MQRWRRYVASRLCARQARSESDPCAAHSTAAWSRSRPNCDRMFCPPRPSCAIVAPGAAFHGDHPAVTASIPVSHQLPIERQPSFERLHTHASGHFQQFEQVLSTMSGCTNKEPAGGNVTSCLEPPFVVSCGDGVLFYYVLHGQDGSSFIRGFRYARWRRLLSTFYVYRSWSQNTPPIAPAVDPAPNRWDADSLVLSVTSVYLAANLHVLSRWLSR